MALALTLDPHGEQLVAAHLRTGRYHSPEEVVTRAREPLAEKEPPIVPTQTMTPAEAGADIRELRKGVTLGGLRFRDLINQGGKYSFPVSFPNRARKRPGKAPCNRRTHHPGTPLDVFRPGLRPEKRKVAVLSNNKVCISKSIDRSQSMAPVRCARLQPFPILPAGSPIHSKGEVRL